MANEADALGSGFIDHEFLRMAEVLVDAPTALCGNRHQQRGIYRRARNIGRSILLGRHMIPAFLRNDFAIGVTLGRIVNHRFRQLVEREFLTAIFTQKAHSISATLAAVAHEIGAAFQSVLKRFQLHWLGATLAGEAKMRAMFGSRNQRHDVVQERAARLHPLVHFEQMLIIDAGNHHRIDFGENAACSEHFEAEHLALVQDF